MDLTNQDTQHIGNSLLQNRRGGIGEIGSLRQQ
jgi:hypothetical protein